jgi:hypothetical protein
MTDRRHGLLGMNKEGIVSFTGEFKKGIDLRTAIFPHVPYLPWPRLFCYFPTRSRFRTLPPPTRPILFPTITGCEIEYINIYANTNETEGGEIGFGSIKL